MGAEPLPNCDLGRCLGAAAAPAGGGSTAIAKDAYLDYRDAVTALAEASPAERAAGLHAFLTTYPAGKPRFSARDDAFPIPLDSAPKLSPAPDGTYTFMGGGKSATSELDVDIDGQRIVIRIAKDPQVVRDGVHSRH